VQPEARGFSGSRRHPTETFSQSVSVLLGGEQFIECIRERREEQKKVDPIENQRPPTPPFSSGADGFGCPWDLDGRHVLSTHGLHLDRDSWRKRGEV
jgi:hypothetical protein